MHEPAETQVTRILADGGPHAVANLLPLVYEQLRAIARQRMAGERPGHSLEATALVHEAYARLVGVHDVAWANRGHFFFAAAEAMRRILIEHARARAAIKRGGDSTGRPPRRVSLNVVDVAAAEDPEAIEALDAAVRELEQQDPDVTAIVRLRFYAGLSVPDTARTLGRSERTAQRDWALARAWLFNRLTGA